MAVITISRQSGSLGREIAEQLAEKLNMPLITRKQFLIQRISDIATPYELNMLEHSPKFYLTPAKDGVSFKEHIQNRLLEEASKNLCVILGMGGQIIFANHPNAINIRVIASERTRFAGFCN